MSKKPDKTKSGASTDADASASGAGLGKKKKSGKRGGGAAAAADDGSDSGSDSDDGAGGAGGGAGAAAVDSDSDDDAVDPKTGHSKTSKAALDSAEKSEIAAYLSTPSTYVSSTPGLPLSSSERAERLEMEELLSKIKAHQKGLMGSRSSNIRELESMKATLKRVKKDTEELMKNQQTNLATMGRKLH